MRHLALALLLAALSGCAGSYTLLQPPSEAFATKLWTTVAAAQAQASTKTSAKRSHPKNRKSAAELPRPTFPPR